MKRNVLQHWIAAGMLGIVAIGVVGLVSFIKTHASATINVSATAANSLPTATVDSVTNSLGDTIESSETALTLVDDSKVDIHIKGTVTDLNGCSDLSSVLAVAYHGASLSDADCVSGGGGGSGTPNEKLGDTGFEVWSDASTLYYWQTSVAVGAPTISRESGVVHGGTYSAKVTGNGDNPDILGLQNTVVTGRVAGETATYSGWATHNGESGGVGGAFFLNGDIASATEIYDFATNAWVSVTGGSPWGTMFGGNPSDYIAISTASPTWVQFTGTLPVPANGTIAMVALGVPVGGGAFTVYLDDYSLTLVDGSGGGGGSPGGSDNAHCAATQSNCSITSCSGTTGQYDCTLPIWFNSDATGSGGTYESDTWKAIAVPFDTYLADGHGNEVIPSDPRTFEIAPLTALALSGNITFGRMDLDSTTSSVELLIKNTGNKSGESVSVSATDMTCDATGSIPASNIRFSTSNVAFDSMTALNGDHSDVSAGLSLATLQSTSTVMTSSTFFNLHTPASGIGGACTGTLTFTAS